MAAMHRAWLASLAANCPPCRCGHMADFHHRGKSCTAVVDEVRMEYCKCEEFRVGKSEEEIEMAKEKKAAKKPKGQGRTPTLAPYVDAPFKIWMKHDGKEHEAQVLSTGAIKFRDKEFTSPSSAGQAVLGKNSKGKQLQVDGWKAWRFNKNGERVPLDALRGSKSPLAEAPKAKKSAPKAAKPKRAAKPRAPKLPAAEPPTTMAERQAARA